MVDRVDRYLLYKRMRCEYSMSTLATSSFQSDHHDLTLLTLQ